MTMTEQIALLQNREYLQNNRRLRRELEEDIELYKSEISNYSIYLYLDPQSQHPVPFIEERKAFCAGYIIGAHIHEVGSCNRISSLLLGSSEQYDHITTDILCRDPYYDAFADDPDYCEEFSAIRTALEIRYGGIPIDRPKTVTLFEAYRAFIVGYEIARYVHSEDSSSKRCFLSDDANIGDDLPAAIHRVPDGAIIDERFFDTVINGQYEDFRDTATEIQKFISEFAN